MLRVHFRTFSDYETFKRAISVFNEQVLSMRDQEVKDVSKAAHTTYVSFIRITGERELRKAPIRMLEDDSASKYIYKMQRHFKF